MARPIDPEILAGFLAEVRGYLPRIASALAGARDGDRDPKAFAEAYRLMHSIKGASSMIGLAGLSHIAFYAEQLLDELQLGERILDDPLTRLLGALLDRIDATIDGIDSAGGAGDGELASRERLAATVAECRRLRGLPPEGDAAELESLLEAGKGAPPVEGLSSASPAVEEPQAGGPSPFEEETLPDLSMLDFDALPSAREPVRESIRESKRPAIAADLLETFLEEAEVHLQAIAGALRALSADAADRSALLSVRRSVHTLKGAASLVGFGDLARIAHRMEDLLDSLADGGEEPSESDLQLLFRTTDALEDLAAGGTPADLAEIAEIAELAGRYDARLGDGEPSAAPAPLRLAPPLDPGPSLRLASFLERSAPEEPVGDLGDLRDRADSSGDSMTAGSSDRSADRTTDRMTDRMADRTSDRMAGPTLRVPLERLDDVVRLASELVVHRSVFERHVAELQRRVDEMIASHERLRRLAGRLEADYEVRALLGVAAVGSGVAPVGVGASGFEAPSGFDPLELDRYTEFHLLSRELAETASDLSAVGVEITSSLVDFDGDLTRLGRLSSDVQNRLMRLRMVPLAQLASRLHRTVRVTAEQEGKQVDLEIVGETVEIDKTVLEELADPLLHLLRNAVAHGIEPAALRSATGKPARGRIRVHAIYEGTQVTVRVSDDGAGMDPQGLIAAALAAGRITEEAAATLSEEQAIDLAFLPGLSTAGALSEVSGRGVGLDVVKAGVHRAKGNVSVRSAPGLGTTFSIRLPMSLAVAKVLMVRSRGETFAVPLASVAQILRVDRSAVETFGREPVISLDGKVYPFLDLGERLRLGGAPEEPAAQVPVLFLSLGERKAALAVDQVGQAREVVVKPLGPLLGRVPGISSATLSGDGEVVLIVNPSELVGIDPGAGFEVDATSGPSTAAPPRPIEVMVVDDSLSVRRVLGNLIHGAGWRAVPARDGLEALELLQEGDHDPDVLLLDIEMPRMDGYELTATLRGMPEFAGLPIVILTSRAGEKHRQRAFELGATEYLVKPYEDATLLAVVRRLAREARPT